MKDIEQLREKFYEDNCFVGENGEMYPYSGGSEIFDWFIENYKPTIELPTDEEINNMCIDELDTNTTVFVMGYELGLKKMRDKIKEQL